MRMLQLYSGDFRPKAQGKEMVILSEIGLDEMFSATPFVDYINEKYGFSKSGVWYNLKKLKKKGLLEFTEKGEEQKPLRLTRSGLDSLRSGLSRVHDSQRQMPPLLSRAPMPGL